MTRAALASLLFLGCGARSGLVEPIAARDVSPTCATPAPGCVRASEDPCGARALAPATCEGTAWRCPPDARPYERVAEAASCVPTPDLGGTLRGSIARVPTGDGRCLWIAGEHVSPDGRVTRNAAFEADRSLPFGRCPQTLRRVADLSGEAVWVEGRDPRDIVQLTGGFWLGGAWFTYRLFRADGGAHFGLSLVGTGLGRWSAGGVELSRVPDVRFAPMDLGDASLVWRERAYVYGCPGPPDFLTERCVLARFDVDERGEVFVGGSTPWAPLAEAARAAQVFTAGPWVSSVFATSPASLAQVFAVGFGSDLQLRTAGAPEGPWSSPVSLTRCVLPTNDPGAYCAGPVAHPELDDPARPMEHWVSYGVGTTSPDGAARMAARPAEYATRFARVTFPR